MRRGGPRRGPGDRAAAHAGDRLLAGPPRQAGGGRKRQGSCRTGPSGRGLAARGGRAVGRQEWLVSPPSSVAKSDAGSASGGRGRGRCCLRHAQRGQGREWSRVATESEEEDTGAGAGGAAATVLLPPAGATQHPLLAGAIAAGRAATGQSRTAAPANRGRAAPRRVCAAVGPPTAPGRAGRQIEGVGAVACGRAGEAAAAGEDGRAAGKSVEGEEDERASSLPRSEEASVIFFKTDTRRFGWWSRAANLGSNGAKNFG